MTAQSNEPEAKRETGRIKWFNFNRGYGFIISDESGKDIFVHYTGISEEVYQVVKENDRVEYTVIQGRKGLQAVDVVVLDE